MSKRLLLPGMRHNRGRSRALVTTVAASLLLPLAAAPASAQDTPGQLSAVPVALPGSMESMEITLVTGDVLQVTVPEQGPATAAVGGEGSPVLHQFVENDDLYVAPPSARQLIANGVLDQELFNIDKLADAGYTDGVPVIVDYRRPAAAQAAATAAATGSSPAVAGIEAPQVLNSIGAVATTVTPDGSWWQDVLAAADPGTAGIAATGPLAGVEKVWLDAPAELALDESVPQIGAPQAWAGGFDGSGVTVAVLDTGIDNEHPDVAGKVVASADFTDTSPEVDDDYGHGTHVAATVAGDGAASGGTYTGVAPGASLVDGKVCDAAGQCPNSAIIAAMEWATVTQDADVVNLSLGGCCTDGTDPVAQAVNQLSAQTGALFVASAGNTGASFRVGTPAVADAALAVGAVDKSDQLANFSSRGPRIVDYAVKPDVTAPGVDIAAARADGTSMGSPVDDSYTTASGTSMAAPHVAGAAAILMQQHPNWTWRDVKGALASTGVRGDYTVWEQGGGRIDLARATSQGVYSPSGSLSFGIFAPPYDAVTKTVTYRNDTGADVTVDLALAVSDKDGQPAAELVSLSADSVTIPAGGAASVEVTVLPVPGKFSRYSGYLTASAGDVRVQTALGFVTEPPKHTVTVHLRDRDGNPAEHASISAVDMRTGEGAGGTQAGAGVWEVRIPTGTYRFLGFVDGLVDGALAEFTVVGDLEVEVEGEMEITFDSRDAEPLTARVAGRDLAYSHGVLMFWSTGPTGISSVSAAFLSPDRTDYFVQPMDPVTEGSFVLCGRHILTHPELGFAGPELFDLPRCDESGGIPADLSVDLDRREVNQLVRVPSTFAANTTHAWFGEFRSQFPRTDSGQSPPIGSTFWGHFPGPVQRVDYVTAGEGLHTTQVRQYTEDEDGNSDLIAAFVFGNYQQRQRGEDYSDTWFQGPLTPTFSVNGTGSDPSVRRASSLDLRIYGSSDSGPGHIGLFHARNQLRVFQDGELVASRSHQEGLSSGATGWVDVVVSPGDHEFRVELDTDVGWIADQVVVDFPHRSPQTSTAWTVQSAAPQGDEPTVLPLLYVDYDLPLNQFNELDRPGRANLEFQVMHQDGADGGEIAGLKLWLSTDDGETWTPAAVNRSDGGAFSSPLLVHNKAEREVSLKVEAWDADGNRIEQEIIRAFGIDTTR